MSRILKLDADYYTENATRYVFLDGRACRHITDCYETLQRQLSFPDYFGNNLDALEEVLADLDWIAEKKIKIILANTSLLLSKDKDRKKDFLDILNSCENEKTEIIYLGNGGQ